jgi:hypothetical protein
MTGAMRVTMKREVVAKKKVDMEEEIENAVVRFVKTSSTTMERQLTHQVQTFGKIYCTNGGKKFDGSIDSDLKGALLHFEGATSSGGFRFNTAERAEAFPYLLSDVA